MDWNNKISIMQIFHKKFYLKINRKLTFWSYNFSMNSEIIVLSNDGFKTLY